MIKKMALMMILFFSTHTFASNFFAMTPFEFTIPILQGREKLELALKYPEGLLQKFNPQKVKVSNKKVSNNNLSFTATKSILMISQSLLINGTFASNEDNTFCKIDEVGYLVTFNFAGSDQIVADSFDRIEVNLCTKEQKEFLIIMAKPKIIKGENYSKILGSFARDIIEAQIQPLLSALQKELSSN